jgi:hypothetical protein
MIIDAHIFFAAVTLNDSHSMLLRVYRALACSRVRHASEPFLTAMVRSFLRYSPTTLDPTC